MIEEFLKDIITSHQIDNILEEVNKITIMNERTDGLLNKRILCKNFLYKLLSTYKEKKKINNKVNTTKLLTNQLFCGSRLITLIEKFPNVNRNVGKIPKIFFKRIGKKKHKDCAIKLYEILAEYSQILNYSYDYDIDDDNYIECKNNKLAKELKKLLRQKVHISYIGHGCNGNCFKLTISKHDYCYKVFFPHYKNDLIFDNEKHGCDAEIHFAIYAHKYGRYGQFAKFYFGRLSSIYERDSFMVTEFISSDFSNNKTQNLHLDYLTIKDSEIRRYDNTINGKIVDYGGLIESRIPELKNPKMRRLIRVICKHINYTFNPDFFEFYAEINERNFDSLQKFVLKNYDRVFYLKAVKLINENIKNIPKEFIKELKKLNKPIKAIEKLAPKDLITHDLKKLEKNLLYYNIKIKTSAEPNNIQLGYIIADLNNNKVAVFRYDENNKIQEIRFEKLKIGNSDILLRLTGDEIKNPPINDFQNILGANV